MRPKTRSILLNGGICHAKAALLIQARISAEHSYTLQLTGTYGARDIQLAA